MYYIESDEVRSKFQPQL